MSKTPTQQKTITCYTFADDEGNLRGSNECPTLYPASVNVDTLIGYVTKHPVKVTLTYAVPAKPAKRKKGGAK